MRLAHARGAAVRACAMTFALIWVSSAGAQQTPNGRYSPRLGIYYEMVPVNGGSGARLTANPVARSPLITREGQWERGDIITHLDSMPITSPAELENHHSQTAVSYINARTGQMESRWVNLPAMNGPGTPAYPTSGPGQMLPGWKWKCNAYSSLHDHPGECSDPSKGGVWLPDGSAPAVDAAGLAQFAQQRGFVVTSTTGGSHNTGSAHYRGRAIDVRTRDHTPAQVDQFIREARAAGFRVRDERFPPPGQPVWSGPHVHLQVP